MNEIKLKLYKAIEDFGLLDYRTQAINKRLDKLVVEEQLRINKMFARG